MEVEQLQGDGRTGGSTVLGQFSGKRGKAGQEYRQFIQWGIGKNIWTEVRGQTILGEEGFADKLVSVCTTPISDYKKGIDINIKDLTDIGSETTRGDEYEPDPKNFPNTPIIRMLQQKDPGENIAPSRGCPEKD
jgi:hypothetical protein